MPRGVGGGCEVREEKVSSGSWHTLSGVLGLLYTPISSPSTRPFHTQLRAELPTNLGSYDPASSLLRNKAPEDERAEGAYAYMVRPFVLAQVSLPSLEGSVVSSDGFGPKLRVIVESLAGLVWRLVIFDLDWIRSAVIYTPVECSGALGVCGARRKAGSLLDANQIGTGQYWAHDTCSCQRFVIIRIFRRDAFSNPQKLLLSLSRMSQLSLDKAIAVSTNPQSPIHPIRPTLLSFQSRHTHTHAHVSNYPDSPQLEARRTLQREQDASTLLALTPELESVLKRLDARKVRSPIYRARRGRRRKMKGGERELQQAELDVVFEEEIEQDQEQEEQQVSGLGKESKIGGHNGKEVPGAGENTTALDRHLQQLVVAVSDSGPEMDQTTPPLTTSPLSPRRDDNDHIMECLLELGDDFEIIGRGFRDGI